MPRRIPWWPIALGSFLLSLGALFLLAPTRQADFGDAPAPPAVDQGIGAARIVETLPADQDAIDGMDQPPPQAAAGSGISVADDAPIDSADISAAMVLDAAFRAAIEEGLNDPDPQVRQETAELFDDFDRAARGLEPREDTSLPPAVNNPSRDRNTAPLPSGSGR